MKNNSVTQFPPHYVKICKPTKFHFCQCHFPQLTDVKKNTFQAVLEALSFTFTHHLFCLLVCCFVGFFLTVEARTSNLCSVYCWSLYLKCLHTQHGYGIIFDSIFSRRKREYKSFQMKGFPTHH